MRVRHNVASLVLAYLCVCVASAEDTALRMGESSYLQTGHIAYLLRDGAVRTLHLVKTTDGPPQQLFSRRINASAGAPILVAEAVVLVDSSGKILKLDYAGKVLFEGALPNFSGASKFSGRLDPTRIYVQNTFDSKTGEGLRHRILIVDVSKKEPVVLASHPTGAVVKTFVSYPDELYLFGLDTVEKVKF